MAGCAVGTPGGPEKKQVFVAYYLCNEGCHRLRVGYMTCRVYFRNVLLVADICER